MANPVDYLSEEAWYDELRQSEFVAFETSTWARNEGLPGEGKMVRGESRRIELKKNSITRLRQLEAESEGDIRKGLQDVRMGFQGLPDELYVGWSSSPLPPSDRHYWLEPSNRRVEAEARALAIEAGRLLKAIRASKGEQAAHADERQLVVMPILEKKKWSRNKLATKAGVSPTCVSEYLDGKRRLSIRNRQAIAEELGLKPESLPNWSPEFPASFPRENPPT
jgi:hypothetical protein